MLAQMVSVERMKALEDIACEAAGGERAPAGWPERGAVELTDVVVRYREHLPDVLKHVSVSIGAGEKVGVCGRTGSGKSTMIAAVVRIMELRSGTISIDGIDIAQLALGDLRSRLSVITQEPLLFAGTLRQNVDPLSEHSDAEIADALHSAQLDSLGSLELTVSDRGGNLSAGQRQLICICRAMLRKPTLMLCDEATANVDTATDAEIQGTMAQCFASCTVVTVAHRLETIMDSSRILVLDQGVVVDDGKPAELLERPESAFSHLVAELNEKPSPPETPY